MKIKYSDELFELTEKIGRRKRVKNATEDIGFDEFSKMNNLQILGTRINFNDIQKIIGKDKFETAINQLKSNFKCAIHEEIEKLEKELSKFKILKDI